MLISKVAYLVFCKCGCSAKIRFADGSESVPFGTKSKGIELCDAMLSIKIDDAEMKALKEQIHGSGLVPCNSQIDSALDDLATACEDIRRLLEHA